MTVAPTMRHVVAAAIVDDLTFPRRVLAARRTSPEALAGQWEFPGGKVEPGESLRDALGREIREELGVSLALGTEIGNPAGPEAITGSRSDSIRAWPISSRLDLRLFTAELREGEPTTAGVHDELRWVSPDDWHEIPWLGPDLPMLVELAEWMRVVRSRQPEIS